MKYLFNLVFLFVVFVSNVYADQTATLTWSPNKEVDLNGYNVYRSCTPIRNYKVIATVGKDVVSYRDTTIPDTCSNVYYKVSAFDTSDNESAKSEFVSKQLATIPVLGIVKDLSVKALNDSSIEVSFTDISTTALGILSYDIRVFPGNVMSWPNAKSVISGTCKSPLIGLVTTQKRVCTITGLLSDTLYQVQLVPFFGTMNQDAQYKDFSNIVSVTTPSKPKAFTNVIIKDRTISFEFDLSMCTNVTKTTIYNSNTKRTIVMKCVE